MSRRIPISDSNLLPHIPLHFTQPRSVQDHVPFEAEMTVPPSVDLAKVINSAHFIDFTEKIKRELQVTIIPHLKSVQEQSIFRFHCQRSNADYLGPARELLETYLVNSNIHVYVPSAHRRADSFADAFPYFNSKVLSSAVVMSGTSAGLGRGCLASVLT